MGGAKPDSDVRTSPATAWFDCLRPSICERTAPSRATGSARPIGRAANIAETWLL